MLIAQITDLHAVEAGAQLLGRIDTNAFLARAVARLAALDPQPDLLVITGDLVDSGAPAQYANVRALLSPLRMPVTVLPGNHDRREEMRAAFGLDTPLPADGVFLHHVVEAGPVRLIALDTLVPGEPWGTLCPGRLHWLAKRLAESPDRPTVVAMHHPPIPTGIPFMDRIALLEGRAELADLLSLYDNIERVICGHVHRPVHARFGGTIASVCPSTAHQIVLTFDAEVADAYVYEPPALQLHYWQPGTGLITHTVPIDATGPPRPFQD